MKNKISYIVLCILLWNQQAIAQWNLYQQANQTGEDCNCFQVKENGTNNFGGVWSTNSVDLTQSFDYEFGVFLSSGAVWNADGMVFVLHNDATSMGGGGGGMGYETLNNSLGVVMDIFENSGDGDPNPFFDHISISRNGVVDHGVADELAGYVEMIPGQSTVQLPDPDDYGSYHTLRVVWNATSMTYSVYFNGVFRLSYTGDIVNSIFGGNPIVYWGMVAGSGGVTGEFKFCYKQTTVEADMYHNDVVCEGDPALFLPSVKEQGVFDLVSANWEFGDGNSQSSMSVIQHNYTSGGVYDVTLTAVDEVGCTVTDVEPFYMHAFDYAITQDKNGICEGENVQFNTTVTPIIPAPCNYQIELNDVFNRGWGSAYVKVILDGDSIMAPGSAGISGGGQTFSILVNDGATIQLEYVSDGTTDDSNTYYLYDSDGNLIYSDGVLTDFAFADHGVSYTGTTSCDLNTTNFSYIWEPSSDFTDNTMANPSITPSLTTQYSVTITDNESNCQSSQELTVTVESPPNAGVGRDTTVCTDGSSFSLYNLITGPKDAGGYFLDDAGNPHGVNVNPAIDVSGVFEYHLDATYCADDVSFITVTINNPPDPGVDGSTTVCSNSGTFNLISVLNGSPHIGGTWYDDQNNVISNQYDPINGNLIARYEIVDPICGTYFSNITVTVEQAPLAGDGIDSTLCTGSDSLMYVSFLSASFDSTGVWTNESGQLVGDYLDPATDTGGIFTYTVNGVVCPSAVSNVTITLQSSPEPGDDGDTTICENANPFDLFLVLNGNPDNGGSWINEFGSAVSSTYTPSEGVSAFTYMFNDPVCGVLSSNVTVTAEGMPNSGGGGTKYACTTGDSLLYNSFLGGSFDTGGTWLNASNDTVDDYFDPANDTLGVFTYTVHGILCPSSSTTVSLNLQDPPSIGANSKVNLCNNGTTIQLFDYLQGNPDSGGDWYDMNSNIINDSFNPSVDSAGTYIYEIDDPICGLYTSNLVVRISYVDSTTFNDNSVTCNGGNDGSISFAASFAFSPYTYAWGNGETSSSISGLNAGNYQVTFTDSLGCIQTFSFLINEPTILTVTSSQTNSNCDFQCNGTRNFETFGGAQPLSVSYDGFGMDSLCAGNYSITVSDGCTTEIVNWNIVSEDNLIADFGIDYQNEFSHVQFNDSSKGNVTAYNWNFDNGDVSSERNPLVYLNDTGSFAVQLVVENSFGCLDTAVKEVYVEPYDNIFIPTVFSPNQDGVNDTFEPHIPYTKSASIVVYNRWGGVVVRYDNLVPGWDGATSSGVRVPEGVYYFVLEYQTYQSDEVTVVNGYINLVR